MESNKIEDNSYGVISVKPKRCCVCKEIDKRGVKWI